MSSRLNDSTAQITKFFEAGKAMDEEHGWVSQDAKGDTKMKILAIDETNKSMDLLLWLSTESTFGSGKHTHGGETYVYVIEGGYNLTAYTDFDDQEGKTTWYGKGDFVYQPFGQIHTESLGSEHTLLYVSNRCIHEETIFEGFDEKGSVAVTEKISDIRNMLHVQ